RQVGDRWTAWNPPVPPEGAEVYIIQSGDSLWGLAASRLGDGNLWPQIWELNSYIADAHWIYPGDPLVMPGATQNVNPSDVASQPLDDAADTLASGGDLPVDDGSDAFSDLLDGTEGGGGAWDPSFAARDSNSAPVPLGFESDIYCSGYIGADNEEFPYSVAASEYEFLTPTLDPTRDREVKGRFGSTETEKFGLNNGDIVYLSGGRSDGLSAGELLTAIDPQEIVRHPLTNNKMGRYYSYKGRIRVLSVQDDTAIGEIVRTCEPIRVGVSLRVFEPEPVPLRRRTPMRPVNMPADNEQLDDAPIIIASLDKLISFGPGYLVFVDQGESQDVLPGDVFTIYRKGRRGYPPIILGELGILSVQDDTALARILDARYSVYVGDSIVIK
ncbi:MAG: LysM peptidoglycan-binding domain-containing protein, partial [Acidobacteriota bacterium]